MIAISIPAAGVRRSISQTTEGKVMKVRVNGSYVTVVAIGAGTAGAATGEFLATYCNHHAYGATEIEAVSNLAGILRESAAQISAYAVGIARDKASTTVTTIPKAPVMS